MHEKSDDAQRPRASRQDILDALGSRIGDLRKAQERAQADLARDAGMHQSEWSRIETGKVEPGLLLLLGLQQALGVDSLEALLGDLPSQRVVRAANGEHEG